MTLSQSDRIERYKLGLDYLKYVTTLSTGSIVLMATFMEKLFAKPLWKSLLVISFTGFMISILGSTVAYTLFVAYRFPGDAAESPTPHGIGGICVLFTWIGFLVGILSLAVFAIRNLLQ